MIDYKTCKDYPNRCHKSGECWNRCTLNPNVLERYWLCLNCGLELHEIPEFAEPMKCPKCKGIIFLKMNRKTIPLKEWRK